MEGALLFFTSWYAEGAGSSTAQQTSSLVSVIPANGIHPKRLSLFQHKNHKIASYLRRKKPLSFSHKYVIFTFFAVLQSIALIIASIIPTSGNGDLCQLEITCSAGLPHRA
jgi:hypothetical protein